MVRYLMIILSCGLFSCSSFDGVIEKRDKGCNTELPNSKKVFLVNKSSNKKYKFTIKSTETANDTSKEYSTQFVVLEPGDETYLDCDEKLGVQLFDKKKIPSTIDTVIFIDNHNMMCTNDTSLLKYNLPFEFIYNEKDVSLEDVNEAAQESRLPITEYVVKAGMFICIPKDNIEYEKKHITGDTKEKIIVIVDDLSKPLPRIHYKKEFEIKGQIEIKEKK